MNKLSTSTSTSVAVPDKIDMLSNNLPYQIINLRYDVTPINNISAVVTETGLIPPTSIPVFLRQLRAETSSQEDSSSGNSIID